MAALQKPWTVRGKRVLVTGGSSGIGKATVIALARDGAHVVFTARDIAAGMVAKQEIEEEARTPVEVRQLDLASFDSILAFARSFLEEFSELHVLVHNGGVLLAKRQETEDGFEMTFGVNHLGPFTLNRLLLPLLKKSAPGRIVVVASHAHLGAGQVLNKGLDFNDLQSKQSYQGIRAFAASKLANVLFTRHLAKVLADTGLSAFCLHPGILSPGLSVESRLDGLYGSFLKLMSAFFPTAKKGARNIVYLCTKPGIEDLSGEYFLNREQTPASNAGRDDAAALQLWEVSEALSSDAYLPNYPI
ncbi:MAG: NAD(P)-dependent dehydrogenase (short-subunit alcohol dehydrogenase family) [Bacteroidia bacterium]|jgi:NAD(P)-dependent dehydrogenase (short-subunit alcohol dehydrogenase family)